MTRVLHMMAAVAMTTAPGADVSDRDPAPQAVVAGFGKRVDAMFRAESGKDLVRAKKKPPLASGRSPFVRAYSYSMVAFAARCLYLGEMLDQANAALAENARYFINNPDTICDRDSFHWHADIVMRLIEMYGTNGTRHPGRLTEETESLALQPIWIYASTLSSLDKAAHVKSKTWHIYSSENHHAMDFTVCWHFSKLAKDRPAYASRPYDDGATAADHYRAWNDYFVAYCRERAMKSPCVEMMSDGYNATLIRGIYNFHDFGPPPVRRAAGMFLDLYFAYWAQEQLNGVSGGGKSRIDFGKGLRQNREHGNAPLAWFYFGIGKQPIVGGQLINAALSDYRPPAVVADIARDVEGRGRYEVRQRVQGLGKQGSSKAKMSRHDAPNELRTDGGGILRYTYCDPAFIIGTPMTEARPLSNWVAISTQNRWQGVIFAGEDDARIVPVVRPKNNWRALNAQWSVQSKGSLITQKLKYHKGGAEMVVWMSIEGLSAPMEEEDLIFVEAEGAYAAIRVPSGGYRWNDETLTVKAITGERVTRPGRTMVLNDEFAPLVLEVMAKSDVDSFEVFKDRVRSAKLVMNGPLLEYTTVYGDRLTFDTSFRKAPAINGEPVNYAPRKVFESPFLNADYNRGVVTISKGERKKVLDFTK